MQVIPCLLHKLAELEWLDIDPVYHGETPRVFISLPLPYMVMSHNFLRKIMGKLRDPIKSHKHL